MIGSTFGNKTITYSECNELLIVTKSNYGDYRFSNIIPYIEPKTQTITIAQGFGNPNYSYSQYILVTITSTTVKISGVSSNLSQSSCVLTLYIR